jgi:hypothetical protein
MEEESRRIGVILLELEDFVDSNDPPRFPYCMFLPFGFS